MKDNDTVQYSYIIEWKENRKKIDIELTSDRMKVTPRYLEREDLPEWVDLDFQKCEICPLDSDKVERCPAALSIVDIIEEFENTRSTVRVKLEIITPERKIIKKTQMQEALSSVLELCLWVSGCPVLDEFSAMGRFRLPFTTIEETIFRITSSYLIRQYFIDKSGEEPDWDLEGIKDFYDKVAVVNGKLAKRIRAGSCEDAGVNALVRLDSFAKNFEYLFENSMDILEKFFR